MSHVFVEEDILMFYLCPRLSLVRETVAHREGKSIVLLSRLCFIAGNEVFLHHDDVV